MTSAGNEMLWRIVFWIMLLLSLTVHEFAHAWSAWRLGDDTAARQGRLTLNPMAHIDLVGTVLLPLLGVPFGWAKPVPVNPLRFRHNITMRQGMMITAVAGPLSNLLLGAAFMLLVVGLAAVGVPVGSGALSYLLIQVIAINVILAFFNMLPVPPLDGSRVADGLMPVRLRPQWERFVQFGPLALLAIILLPNLLGISLFSLPLKAVFGIMGWLLGVVS